MLSVLSRGLLGRTVASSWWGGMREISQSTTSQVYLRDRHADSLLTEAQLELRESTEKFVAKEVDPLVDTMDKTDSFPMPLWKKFGDMGLLGVTAEPEYGGLGLSYFDHHLVAECLARSSSAVALSYGCHAHLAINTLTVYGTKEQKAKYLPALISGDHVGALSMSEHSNGSDVMNLRTTATPEADGSWLLNGTKMWCTNGPDADVLLVFARSSADRVSCFIVEKGFEGFRPGKKLDKMTHRGSNTSELIFDNCRVPKENVLGKLHTGTIMLMKNLAAERLVFSAFPIGAAQGALDHTLRYVHLREQFGQRIGEFQMIQKAIIEMWSHVASSRLYLYTLARNITKNPQRTDVIDINAAAAHVSESSQFVCRTAVQCFGGNGVINDYPVSRFARDSYLYTIGGGTNEIRRWLAGRELNALFPK